MSADAVEHTRLDIGPSGFSRILDDGPIPATHVRGMSVFSQNEAAANVTLEVQESDDRATWYVVPFSSPWVAGLLSLELVPKSEHTILFQIARRYLRFASLPVPQAGSVHLLCVQFPPRGAAEAEEGS